MITVLVSACFAEWVVQRAHLQRDAVAAIKRAGGLVEYDWQRVNGRRVPNGKPKGPGWLVDRLGPDYFADVTCVHFRGRRSDAELAHIGNLRRLESLDLSGTAVTDAGLAHLKGLTRLQSLRLSGTTVTDAGLAHLKGLTRLQTLTLDYTEVSDLCLPHLKGLNGLRFLSLFRTKANETGLEELRQAMPSTRVEPPAWPSNAQRRGLAKAISGT
jgi:hypothetical protein